MTETTHVIGEPKKLIAATIVVAIFWLAFVLYVFSSILRVTPVSLPFQNQSMGVLQKVFPQGWGFFTRDPQSDEFYIYKYENGSWLYSFSGPSAEPSNLFGFSRFVRAQGVEYGLISQSIIANDWSNCNSPVIKCLNTVIARKDIVNTSSDKIFCGTYGFALQKTKPWAWKNSELVMPSKYAVLRVVCE